LIQANFNEGVAAVRLNILRGAVVSGILLFTAVVPGVAQADTASGTSGAPTTGTSATEVKSELCGTDYNSCVTVRSEFDRYYTVGPIGWSSWAGQYYFDYW
jgi:hypothetical protein